MDTPVCKAPLHGINSINSAPSEVTVK